MKDEMKDETKDETKETKETKEIKDKFKPVLQNQIHQAKLHHDNHDLWSFDRRDFPKH